MKRIKLLLITTIALFIAVNSCYAQEKKTSLLWEISGNGLKTTSYLFGTIHMIPADKYLLTDKMKEKFDSCKTLAMEVDINMDLKQKIELAKQVVLPNKKTIDAFMTPDDYKKFKNWVLKDLKIKKKKFKKIVKVKPFFATSIILTELMGDFEQYEQNFNKMAKKRKMKIVGLETMAYQMNLVDKISLEDQIKMNYIDALGTNPLENYNDLFDAYSKQNLDKMYKLTQDESSDIDGFADDFLDKRNTNWIPKIEKLTKEQSTFIAVGAAHLVGENGVISLLRKQGYTVKPIK